MKDLINKVERMTSIEIAKLTGKPHNDVLKAIRAMEPAWKKVNLFKFFGLLILFANNVNYDMALVLHKFLMFEERNE